MVNLLMAVLIAAPLTPADRIAAGDPHGALSLLTAEPGAPASAIAYAAHAAGQLPQAISAYLRAQRAQPESLELRLNLGLARAARSGEFRDAPEPWPLSGLPWSWLMWLGWLSASLALLSRWLGRGLERGLWLVGVLCLLTLVAAEVTLALDSRAVAGHSGQLRVGPSDDEPVAGELAPGLIVTVEDSDGAWRLVRDGGQGVGWCRSDALLYHGGT